MPYSTSEHHRHKQTHSFTRSDNVTDSPLSHESERGRDLTHASAKETGSESMSGGCRRTRVGSAAIVRVPVPVLVPVLVQSY
ncbi:hypothetical protein EYF80_049318 [Liparis tanakae]|uniref:Uncharacterized protein n=1 Tax=Liparis tanakae TaxID=230148 RepID=A0A4Z2FH65_9TELE|nr:hypothetical protein EYF80_049318 [Liparis tanakae]